MRILSFLWLLLLGSTQIQAQEAEWHTDVNKALQLAVNEKKPMLLFFTGSDWCGWCKKLVGEVFSKEEFKTWAKEKVVLVEFDFPRRTKLSAELQKQNREFQQIFKVSKYPTVVLVEPEVQAAGKVNFRSMAVMGYMAGGAKNWVATADKVISSNKFWMDDINQAIPLSLQTGKPILFFFTGSDWCGWCKRLIAEVFSKDAFKTWAKEKFILVELDFPRRRKVDPKILKQNQQLQQMFGVKGYPTIVIAQPKVKEASQVTFDKLGQLGYMAGGPEAWKAEAEKQIKANTK